MVLMNIFQEIIEWLEKRTDKYTSPDIQNEILKLMSHSILRDIVKQIQQADFFTIMVDECVDGSNKEQLVVCFRHVDVELGVHEDFIGLYHCPDVTAHTIVSVIKDTLLRLNLQSSRCRGQCYDGGSNMASSRKGVKTQILQEGTTCIIHSLLWSFT